MTIIIMIHFFLQLYLILKLKGAILSLHVGFHAPISFSFCEELLVSVKGGRIFNKAIYCVMYIHAYSCRLLSGIRFKEAVTKELLVSC